MSRDKIAVATVATVALVLSLLAAGGAPASASTSVGGTATLGVAPLSKAPNLNWEIRPGVRFNDPRKRDRVKFRINRTIKKTIKHTPAGEKIKIMTWNLASRAMVRKLVKAHERGVSVRVFMSRGLFREQGYYGPAKVLKRALKGDKDRRKGMRSWIRTCSGACRGKPGTGSMHSKFMIVTRSGARRRIVSQGSANFTGAGATLQWNDWYTIYENRTIWKAYKKVFRQSKKDRKRKAVKVRDSRHQAWFDPRLKKDPVLKTLRKVTCKGARGDAGNNGRTVIRVAAAVFENWRGMRIARKLRRLHNENCEVRVIFTMMPERIREALGPIPLRHLAYDWDGDGSYDRYMHMKAMTISGRWKKDRSHHLVLQGSPNWDALSRRSDEQGMVIHRADVEQRYSRKIDKMFNFAPLPGAGVARRRHDVEVYEDNPAAYDALELERAGQG